MSLTESALLLAITRFREACDLDAVIEAIVAGGIPLVEVTIDRPGVLEAVRRSAGAGRIVGVGTVTTVDQVARRADAGARFVVSPGTVDEVVAASLERGVEPTSSARSPRPEILGAMSIGAPAVELFPASLGGPAHLRALRGPFPRVPIVPTGGIGPGEVGSYLTAGATCVGVGGEITGPNPAHHGRGQDRIAARAAEAVAGVSNAGSP
jgi:2-dehydro-3-deoxyphosphogluconate aldolase / (4S)-4-hydroxy-2-oxoglutarate aldolase